MKATIKKKNGLIFFFFIMSFLFRDLKIFTYYGQWLTVMFGIALYVLKYKWFSCDKENFKALLPYLLFLVLSLFSSLWAYSSHETIETFTIIIRLYCLAFILCGNLKNLNDVYDHIKILWIIGLLLFIYLIIRTPFGDWIQALNGSYGIAEIRAVLPHTLPRTLLRSSLTTVSYTHIL